MKQFSVLLFTILLTNIGVAFEKDTTFQVFEKSNTYSGFGGVTFNMFAGNHVLIGGEGAAIFGNFYLGGFGYGGSLGKYTYPFGAYSQELTKQSGGIVVGALSNTKAILSLYTDLKLSWDHYVWHEDGVGTDSTSIEYSGFSFLPTIGVAIRPTNFLQLKLGYGYNFSSLTDDGGLENVPYNAGQFTFGLTFGGF
jgi:hypothetical protein